VSVDKVVDNFLELAQTPAHFKAVIDGVRGSWELCNKLSNLLLHCLLLLARLVVQQELGGDLVDCFFDRCLALHD